MVTQRGGAMRPCGLRSARNKHGAAKKSKNPSLYDPDSWGERKMLVVMLVALGAFIVWCIAWAVASMLGKDVWPYTVKGPLRSTEEEVWMRKAILEYEKKVPPP